MLKSLALINYINDFNFTNEKIMHENLFNFTAKKLAYFLYQIDFNSPTRQPVNSLTLYLSQSYHPGWKAYIIKHQTSNIKQFFDTYFPFIFGKELKDHVLINNWANGWIISSNIKQLTSNNLDNQKLDVRSLVLVVFWPQYLEFIGFFLLITAFLFILTYPSRFNK
jgi:hypothetical protein